MQKRGQITIFILLGVIILIILMLFFFVFYQKEEVLKPTLTSDAAIEAYIESCLEEISVDGLSVLGAQGGLIAPTNYLQLNNATINYWYDKEVIKPSLEDIESNLEDYLDIFLPLCINSHQFKNIFFNLPILISDVKLGNKVKIETSEIEFIKKDITYKLNPITKEFNLNFHEIYNTASKITDKTAENPSIIDFTFFNTLEIKVDAFPHKDSFVYIITDQLNKKPYIFTFAVKLK